MRDYCENIICVFRENANPDYALQMKKYLKDQFEFFGINTPKQRELSRPFLQKDDLPTIKEVNSIAKILWKEPQRELQGFALELLSMYKKKFPKNQIGKLEWLTTHKSWWDTVDFIAGHLVGSYFLAYPDTRTECITKWLQSNNIWLQRTAIIFQLKYREKTDPNILEQAICHCKQSKEFFIRKAIGWALRQYAKTDPEYVITFVKDNPDLSPLSKREALKNVS